MTIAFLRKIHELIHWLWDNEDFSPDPLRAEGKAGLSPNSNLQ